LCKKILSRAAPVCVDPGVGSRDEPELIRALQRGEPGALEQAYEAHCARLFGYLARMARRRDVAEDLLQETWMRLAARAHELHDDTDLGAWLFTVARNLFLSHVRRAMTGADCLYQLRFWESAEVRATPFDLTSASETQRRLEQALLLVPIDYREVLVLVVIERMEPAAVARVLGIKPEAVRKRLERARAMLADRLAELVRARGGEP
jgi:RNA polymerase sigma-70 factor (ECF subfamily)